MLYKLRELRRTSGAAAGTSTRGDSEAGGWTPYRTVILDHAGFAQTVGDQCLGAAAGTHLQYRMRLGMQVC